MILQFLVCRDYIIKLYILYKNMVYNCCCFYFQENGCLYKLLVIDGNNVVISNNNYCNSCNYLYKIKIFLY